MPNRAFHVHSVPALSHTKNSCFWSYSLTGTFPHSSLKQYVWKKIVFIGTQKSHARKKRLYVCWRALQASLNKQALSMVKSLQQTNRKVIISCSSIFIAVSLLSCALAFVCLSLTSNISQPHRCGVKKTFWLLITKFSVSTDKLEKKWRNDEPCKNK